jgi:hypothetical protein
MRPILVFLTALVLLATGIAGFVLLRPSSTGAPELAKLETASPAAAGEALASRNEVVELRSRIDQMTMELAQLNSELRAMRDQSERAPVEVAAQTPLTTDTEATLGLKREAVLKILAEERDRQQKERDAERIERETQAAKNRASKIAKELSMAPGDEEQLAALMVLSNQKRQEMMDKMRDGGFDRDTARTSFEELRTWQSDQLTRAFGADLAEQIQKLEMQRMGFGGPGGGDGRRGQRGAVGIGLPGGGGPGGGAGGGQQQNPNQ